MPLALWQASLRETVFGASTSFPFVGPIGGLGLPVPRTFDLDRHGDGAVGADDPLPRRVLTFPIGFGADGSTSPAAAGALVQTMKSAWRRSPVDLELGLYLPGFAGELVYFGRPRGLDLDLAHLKSGYSSGLFTFEALDPLGYGEAIEYAADAGPITVENPGDATTDRAVVTIVGNGGTPELSNAGDGGNAIFFANAVGVGEVLELNLHDRTIIDAFDVDRFADLSPYSTWFRFTPGDNELTLTGAATVAVTFRPGFY